MNLKFGLSLLAIESLRRLSSKIKLYEKDNFVLISGNSNKELAQKVAQELKKELGQAIIGRFSDGECQIQILDNVRGKDVFIIQSTCQPVNENFMELLLMISALRRSSAKTINVIIPYFGYSRQDHIGYNRSQAQNKITPISAAEIAKMLESSGADRVISIDLHRGQLQGFFSSIPVDNLESYKPLLEQLQKEKFDLENIAIVSPDFNGVGRAVRFQDMLTMMYPNISTKIAMIYKAKQAYGPPIMSLVGSVKDKNCLIIDDIIDSGLTLTMANLVLKSEGAKLVYAFGTHPIMSNSAFERLSSSSIDRIYCADTIPEHKKEQQFLGHKLQRVSIAAVIAEAILRIQNRSSQQLS